MFYFIFFNTNFFSSEYYDNVDGITRHSDGPETDIIDDVSEAFSDIYQAGQYQGSFYFI